MTNGGEGDILVDGQRIEFVSKYKYLGEIVAMEDRTRKEMRIRTANAWRNFGVNKNVLKSNLHISAKTKIFNQCVVPSLT